jgi:hypothetical protein
MGSGQQSNFLRLAEDPFYDPRKSRPVCSFLFRLVLAPTAQTTIVPSRRPVYRRGVDGAVNNWDWRAAGRANRLASGALQGFVSL